MSSKPTTTAYDTVGAFDALGVEYQGSESDREVRVHCPLHDDRNPSCRVTTDTGAWFCDPCAQGGDFPKLLTALGVIGVEYGRMLTRYGLGKVELDGNGRREGNGAVIDPNWVALPGRLTPSPEKARYEYKDGYGRHVATVHRDGKNFPVQHLRGWPKRSDGLDWVWGHPDTWVLYRLPEVLRAVKADEPVYVCEGEKDADALRAFGVAATTCAGGAGKHGKTDTSPLNGATVIIVADRDAPGLNHAVGLAADLRRRRIVHAIVESTFKTALPRPERSIVGINYPPDEDDVIERDHRNLAIRLDYVGKQGSAALHSRRRQASASTRFSTSAARSGRR